MASRGYGAARAVLVPVLTAVLAATLAWPLTPSASAHLTSRPMFLAEPHAGCTTTVPGSLTHLGNATQVIVVTSSLWTSTHAKLRAYEVRGGQWCRVIAPVDARLGWSGFAWAKDRRQNSGRTPAGTFKLPWAFGNSPDPGSKLDYRGVDANDWWAYDPRSPKTYNRWLEHGLGNVRAAWAEHLSRYGKQYAHAVALKYNLPSATYQPKLHKGGGIFLHVNGSGATAGCVSVSKTDMVRVIQWLDPGQYPVIVMAPGTAITRA